MKKADASNVNPICDHALAYRLEHAEGRANAEFVEARHQAFRDIGACWQEFSGTYAMFDGPDSPCTQTFGLGMSDTLTNDTWEAIEGFFTQRSAPVFHEVCPLVDADVIQQLNRRGYQPIEFSNVNYSAIANRQPTVHDNPAMRIRTIEPNEHQQWADVAAIGWSDVIPELREYLNMLAKVNPLRTNLTCFIAELDGVPIGAAAINISEDIALLAGACTIPEYRNRGAQTAMLAQRLRYAAQRGCELAVIVAAPGSASQRNTERQGFRVAYTRTKWQWVKSKQVD